MMNSHQDCEKICKLLMNYLDGDLDKIGCEQIEAHIAQCQKCQINVDTLLKTIEICKNLPTHDKLPDDIRMRLFHCLRMEEFL